jgi:hypothetical protein
MQIGFPYVILLDSLCSYFNYPGNNKYGSERQNVKQLYAMQVPLVLIKLMRNQSHQTLWWKPESMLQVIEMMEVEVSG